MNKVSTPEFWNQRYLDNNTKWDLGHPTPILTHYLENNKISGKACVLGCGNGHDVIELSRYDIDVYAVDFSIEAIENPNEFVSVPSNFVTTNNQYFGLKVKGLSMIEKGIFDGDIAIIKKTNIALNGKVAAVLTLNNEITLKTINIEKSKIHLIPANKNYQEKVYNINEVQIQGTLSGLIRKYN